MPRKTPVTSQVFLREMEQLYGSDSKFGKLFKAVEEAGGSKAEDNTTTGIMPWPFDPVQVQEFRYGNVQHGRAIEAKVAMTVGLGFVSEEVEDVLDPLTDDEDILSVLSDFGDDYYQLGNGFLEVVRKGSRITGLHHIPAASVNIYKESRFDYHYEVDGGVTGRTVRMARFGQLGRKAPGFEFESEMIHVAFTPSGWNRWYGVPSWITAIPLIKTSQEILQFNFDFFQNRAVPELMAMFIGPGLGPKDYEEIKAKFMQARGAGRQHKTMVLNLPSPELKVQIEKLADGHLDASFLEASDKYDLGVLAAHGVTPALVGIQTSPKLLSQSKEVRDSLQLVQALTIGPSQKQISKRLRRTLGTVFKGIPDKKRVKQEVSGVTQQMVEEPESGWNFKKVTDEFEFDMTPQTGGPKPAAGGSATPKAKKPAAK
jgi:hypothetical protein